MRFNKRITFVTESEGGFNPDTGNHDKPTLDVVTKPCHLSALGVERSKQLYGEVDTNIMIARLQTPHDDVFDYVELNNSDKKYKVTRRSDYRKGVFYLEGAN